MGEVKGQNSVSEFWREWHDRFIRHKEEYITPDNPIVQSFGDNIIVNDWDSEDEIGHKVWEKIGNQIIYELSHEWKKPRQTIKEGVGDCEDRVFLMASVLPNLGVNEFEIVAGEAIVGGKGEYHVWIENNGQVLDPTTTPDNADKVRYKEILNFQIKVE